MSEQGVNFTPQTARRIVDATRWTEGMMKAREGGGARPMGKERRYKVKLTGTLTRGGMYLGRTVWDGTTADATASGALALPEGMTVAAADNVQVINAGENGSSGHALAVDGSVYVEGPVIGVASDGKPMVWVSGGGGGGGVVEVYLTQNGGANGDDGSTTTRTYPTYTYDVFTDAGKTVQVGTAKSVLAHRPLQVAVTAAGHGLYNVASGVLVWVDEYEDQGACP